MPLHQPQCLGAPDQLIQKLRPDVVQVASSIHHSTAPTQTWFGEPHSSCAARVPASSATAFTGYPTSISRRAGAPRSRRSARQVIIAHLAAARSLCMIENGTGSVTGMGFPRLDGIPMATRCGARFRSVKGCIFRNPLGRTFTEVEDTPIIRRFSACRESVLTAASFDERPTGSTGSHRALFALSRRRRNESTFTATLGGIDALVFTAGIGEHQPQPRRNM